MLVQRQTDSNASPSTPTAPSLGRSGPGLRARLRGLDYASGADALRPTGGTVQKKADESEPTGVGPIGLAKKHAKVVASWTSPDGAALGAEHAAPGDVHQGKLADCHALATIAALAAARPEAIAAAIRPFGTSGQRYEVRFFDWSSGTPTPIWIGVDTTFPHANGQPMYAHGESADGERVIWPMVMEKAYAVYLEQFGKMASKGHPKGYEALSWDDPTFAYAAIVGEKPKVAIGKAQPGKKGGAFDWADAIGAEFVREGDTWHVERFDADKYVVVARRADDTRAELPPDEVQAALDAKAASGHQYAVSGKADQTLTFDTLDLAAEPEKGWQAVRKALASHVPVTAGRGSHVVAVIESTGDKAANGFIKTYDPNWKKSASNDTQPGAKADGTSWFSWSFAVDEFRVISFAEKISTAPGKP